MKSSKRDRVEGKLLTWKGSLKKKAGEVVGSPALKAQGQAELSEGKRQQRVGQIRKLVGN